MPYTKISQLPAYIRKLPEFVQKSWMKVFNASFSQYGESKAFAIANSWVKKRLKKTGEGFTANSADFGYLEVYSFQLQPDGEEFIKNSEDGELTLTGILSDTIPWINPSTGEVMSYTPECLETFANQINTEGTTMPDLEHSEYDQILEESNNVDEVYDKLKQRKGLLKDIKAVYDNGKLYIKAKLDKRYRNYARLYKSLSIEAYPKRVGNKYVGGKVLGFTFTNKPVVTTANILKAE